MDRPNTLRVVRTTPRAGEDSDMVRAHRDLAFASFTDPNGISA